MIEHTQELANMFRKEFPSLASNLIWQNDEREYEVFDRYKITAEKHGYRVYCLDRCDQCYSLDFRRIGNHVSRR